MRLAILLTFFTSSLLYGVSDTTKVSKRVYNTIFIKDSATITLDGILDDEIWNKVEWATDFTVHAPNNGEKPQRQTLFKVIYDDDNIYFGFKCLDDPNEVVARMSRRDNFPGDWVEVNIDSYFDKSTAFAFTTSASGVKGDEFVTGNGNNWDTNWNPIWYLKTQRIAEGWSAEIKIPFSQLRFGNKEKHVWGFNVMRRDFKADERSTFQFIPQNQPGWVSNFAELHGIEGISPKRQIEIQPYFVTKLATQDVQAGNPFTDGSDITNSVGIDGKIGVTSDFTLDFTVNPDFGQVEADPSALNIDGFQIFFDERRPFFIENANLFDFQLSQAVAGGPYNNDNLFYSRRIGQRPRGNFDVPSGAYVQNQEFSSIIGAAKVSGKSKDGWSMGVLESVTAEESSRIDFNGNESTAITEPLTNYFAGRLSKDIKAGESRIGGTFTAVNRRLDNTGLEDQFHNHAYSGGLDFYHTWKNREWQISGTLVMSDITGSARKITNTQRSFEHYFQRPDADYLSVDTLATRLTGHGGSFSIENNGGADNISFQTGFTWRSPELELNDIGFMNTADEINHYTSVGYRFPKPFSIFRSMNVSYNHVLRWSYGGDHQYTAISPSFFTNFKNYWTLSTGLNIELKDISSKSLFGGPSLARSKGIFNFWNIGTDSRKNIRLSTNVGFFKAIGSDAGSLSVWTAGAGLFLQPINALSLSFNPSFFAQNRVLQNVSFSRFQSNDRYITGRIKQNTFSLSMRASYSITPNFSIEFWGQPFITRGRFSDYKYITDPNASKFDDRYKLYDNNQIDFNTTSNRFQVDDDQDGSVDYTFRNPDFNLAQWRSNLVLRWEYTPGSELFLVWSQSSSGNADPSKSIYDTIKEDVFDSSVRNNFLFKATYRFLN